MIRSVPALLLAIFVSAAGGCVLMEPSREFWRQTKRIYTPRPYDRRDLTEELGDNWEGVADPIRADQPREEDPDPWYKRWVMSEKARNIERNLGVD
ncbi:MAG: hypothetical protein KY476_19960 [Planctomycetes bacterium]|nr:hypothetical protein [Planctomycetota bacterium]